MYNQSSVINNIIQDWYRLYVFRGKYKWLFNPETFSFPIDPQAPLSSTLSHFRICFFLKYLPQPCTILISLMTFFVVYQKIKFSWRYRNPKDFLKIILKRITEGEDWTIMKATKREIFICIIFLPNYLHALSLRVMPTCKINVLSSLRKLWDEVQMGSLFSLLS